LAVETGVKKLAPSSPDSDPNTPSPSNRRPRCGHTTCKKRLGLVPIECRCGLKLCTEHRFGVCIGILPNDHYRLPRDHACSFDYKSNTRKLLEGESVHAAPIKITRL
jgi:hypothetical protein